MGFFSRRRSEPTAAPDLATEVEAVLQRIGQPAVRLNDDELHVGATALYLDNLRQMTAGLPPDRRAAEIERWARIMTSTTTEAPAAGLEAVRSMIFPRIVHRDAFGMSEATAEIAARNSRHLTPELYLLPALDLPDRVDTVTEPDRHGGWDAIWPVALANLRALPAPAHTLLNQPEGTTPEAVVHLLETEDFFGATRTLVLEEVLVAVGVLGSPAGAPLGTLVAMPSRSVLAVHVITTAAGALGAVPGLAHVAAATLPGALTNRVHYRSPDGALEPVTRRTEQNAIEVDATGAFGAVMERLRG